MRLIDVSPVAERDFDDIVDHSTQEFGLAASDRYARLIGQSFIDLAQDPMRPGVVRQDDLPVGIHLYPVRYSRERVRLGDRVRRPRHVVVFRFDDERVQIVRLLHDAMDFFRHLS